MALYAAPVASGPVRLGEWFRRRRNRLVSNPAFQRWAASCPLTRPIAEKRSRALFDICAGFVYSQILVACVRLELFGKLIDGSRAEDDLAREFGLSLDSTRRLLRAAAALDLVRSLPHGRWTLADLGAAMVGNPSIAAFCEHHALLYDDLRDPIALLRGEVTTRLSQFWPYAGRGPGDAPRQAMANHEADLARYSQLMSCSQELIAQDALDSLGPRPGVVWLDVGAGEGAFISAVAERTKASRLMAFDLPVVAERARQAIARRGLASRIDVFGGDFLNDPLPTGATLISLVRVLHDHDDAAALALLRRVRAALPPNGELVIVEPMAATPGAEPVGDAYFGFYLLAMGGGRPRSPTEIEALLNAADFRTPHRMKTRRPLLTSVISARRP